MQKYKDGVSKIRSNENKEDKELLSVFGNDVKLLPANKYGAGMFNREGELLKVKGYFVNEFYVLEKEDKTVWFEASPTDPKKDVLKMYNYELIMCLYLF